MPRSSRPPLVLAALSLLLPWALAFDPWAWIVWGRESGHFALDTSSGPSWKPFPVLFTTPFALAGDAAPALWLIVARAGGLLALAGVFVLAAHFGGRWAGVAGTAAMALSPWWLFNTALGNSEGMLAAAVLWAIVAHLAGRPRAALALATAAALMRPEVWPFLGAYGVWLWRTDRRAVILAGAAIPLLWFGPDLLGAGGALDASRTARGVPSPGSAKLESIPVLALLRDSAELLTLPALAAVVIAAVAGGRDPAPARGGRRGLGGDRGGDDSRRLRGQPALPGRGGGGRGRARRRRGDGALSAGRRGGARGRGARDHGRDLNDQVSELGSRADAAGEFDGVLAAAGGKDALLRCSRIRTSNRARSLVAWRLDLPMRDLDAKPVRPAVVIRAKWFYGLGLEPPRDPGYQTLATTPFWQIVAACGRAPQVDPSVSLSR